MQVSVEKLEKIKEWRKRNPDKVKLYRKRYKAKHAARIRESDRVYYHLNGGKEACRKYHKNNPERVMLFSARLRAKKLNLAFNLEISDIVIPEFCPILGIKLQRGEGRALPCSPSLDRIIPEKGYIKGNVIIISYRANCLKNNANLDEMRKLVAFYEKIIVEL